MDNLIPLILGIIGPGLITGGIVMYRKSTRSGLRALGAAFIASGAAMLVILLLSTPVFVISG
ncbi:hypothetical protein ACFLWM_01935 [Chloroflexota bacterium]